MSALYLDQDLASAEADDLLELRGAEARHAVTVSKVAVGDTLTVSNGRGLLIQGRVLSAERDRLSYQVEESTQIPASAYHITLVQSLAKGGRDELAIQTATELGISAVIPWQSDRSIVRWIAEKQQKNEQRWQSIVQEATKQSINPWIPQVHALKTTAQLISDFPAGIALVLEPTATTRLVQYLPDRLSVDSSVDITLFVGPEGGLSSRELDALQERGAVLVKMGDLVLRSSTAGPTALALINALTGRW